MSNDKKSKIERSYSVWSELNRKEKNSIKTLFALQIVSAVSDVISLGAIYPLLSLIVSPQDNDALIIFRPILLFFDIQSEKQLLLIAAGFFLISVFLSNIIKIFVIKFQFAITAKIAQTFSAKLLSRILQQDLMFHLRKNVSEHIGIMTHDLNGALGVIQLSFNLITNLMSCIAIIVALIIVDPFFAVGSCLSFILAYTYLILNNRKILTANSIVISANHKGMIQIINESLLNIRDIVLDGSFSVFVTEYSRLEAQMRSAQNQSALIRQIPRYTVEILGASIICIIILFAYFTSEGLSNIVPILGVFAMGSTKLLPALQQVYSSISGMQGIGVSLDKTLQSLSMPVSNRVLHNVKDKFKANYDLTLRDVSYSYDSESGKNKPLLTRINIYIPINKTVAIIGGSGSGKSTLADIMLGLLKPQNGKLLIGGSELVDEDLASWQNIVAYVPQAIFFSETTIARNIAFGIPDFAIDISKVKMVAKLACIDDYINTLPNKYQTILGESGVHFSGGEKQRIGIARALYKGAKFLLFDEATSALDRDTEADVMATIKKLTGLFTIVIITHRADNLQYCSLVYEIRDGQAIAIEK